MANPLKSFATEFRAFLSKGNVLELAIAFMLGAVFGDVVRSAAADLIAPPIGLFLGDLNFVDYFAVLKEGKTAGPYATLEQARQAGAVTLNYGIFVTRVISLFLITSLVLFLIVRAATEMKKRADRDAAPTTKDCDFCASKIPLKATRCPNCTSTLQPAAATAAASRT
ncbi:MAG: MscL family protein [Chloroflexi bacterium]|nr:MscL family protein [Chloroflexota bacterium]